jgi:hypothetical protein
LLYMAFALKTASHSHYYKEEATLKFIKSVQLQDFVSKFLLSLR